MKAAVAGWTDPGILPQERSPNLGRSFVIADVAVVWPRKLAERLVAPGGMSEADVETTHRALAHAFPAA